MGDLSTSIEAVSSAHAQASLRLKQMCQSLEPKRSDGKLNETGRQLLLEMLKGGLTNKDISEALDISSAAVTHYRRQYGVEPGHGAPMPEPALVEPHER